MKMNNFRGELTDISAEKEALVTTTLKPIRLHNRSIHSTGVEKRVVQCKALNVCSMCFAFSFKTLKPPVHDEYHDCNLNDFHVHE